MMMGSTLQDLAPQDSYLHPFYNIGYDDVNLAGAF